MATAHSFLFRVADPGFHHCCLRLPARALITVGTDDQSSCLLPTSTSIPLHHCPLVLIFIFVNLHSPQQRTSTSQRQEHASLCPSTLGRMRSFPATRNNLIIHLPYWTNSSNVGYTLCSTLNYYNPLYPMTTHISLIEKQPFSMTLGMTLNENGV